MKNTPKISTSGDGTLLYINNVPEADIAVNNNRLRKYGKRIYLKDQTEFQIEFTNKTDSTYLANVKLNGRYVTNEGLVLRPGEHLFLERYFDTQKKFQFSTYSVKDTQDNREAIRKNGLVEIEFYREYQPQRKWYRPWYYQPYWNKWDWYTIPCTGGTDGSTTWNNSSTDVLNMNMTYEAVADSTPIAAQVSGDIETGRVEKGDNSDQTFSEVDMDFESFCSKTQTFHLLPMSQKKTKQKDLRNYCSECGRRQKQGWKFCPGCGKQS